MSLLVEIGTAFQPPYASTVAEIADRVWPGVLLFLARPTPAFGKVYDSATRAGLAATITLEGVPFGYDEQPASAASGLYHLWLPRGTHAVLVECDGYSPFRTVVEADEEGVRTDIALVELPCSKIGE